MSRPLCPCGRPCKAQYRLRKDGSTGYCKVCSYCAKKKYQTEASKANARAYKREWQREHRFDNTYKSFKKGYCEECGFSPVHSCQLDVDHVDGNHWNDEPSNLRTLCANCHRLKTYLNKDWETKKLLP